jgi:hypothetical protein
MIYLKGFRVHVHVHDVVNTAVWKNAAQSL